MFLKEMYPNAYNKKPMLAGGIAFLVALAVSQFFLPPNGSFGNIHEDDSLSFFLRSLHFLWTTSANLRLNI
jgi:hypothetical protein